MVFNLNSLFQMLDHKFISNVILNTYKYSKKGIGVAEFHNFFKNEQVNT